MKTVVVYESIYGTTKKYAKWISESLSCDLRDRKSIKPNEFVEYDIIVYGEGMYAGGVAGMKLLTKNFDIIKDKKIVLFTCGLADPTKPENINNIKKSLERALTPEMQEKIQVFHLRGGIDYSKLRFGHKTLMAMLYKMLRKKPSEQLTDEDKEMIATYGQIVDFTDKNTILPIIDCVNALSKQE